MKSISNILKDNSQLALRIAQSRERILKNEEVKSFILKKKLTEEQIDDGLSKFNEFISESEKSSSSSMYQPLLIVNNGRIDVSYRETELLIQERHKREEESRVSLMYLPEEFKKVSWEEDIYNQIDAEDKGRFEAIRYIVNFMEKKDRGSYLFGDFGIGKSYLMAGMIVKLAKEGIQSQMLHYPSFISQANFAAGKQLDEVKKADLLILDDIGGEVNNSWARDSILQVILQYRMDNKLPTFFTSNYSMKELEERLAQTKDTKDSWAAKRVMERIKFLAKEIHMEGKNRRHS
ncbi:MAG: primosomal protein DnaI [Lactovum sp.]